MQLCSSAVGLDKPDKDVSQNRPRCCFILPDRVKHKVYNTFIMTERVRIVKQLAKFFNEIERKRKF